MTDFLTTNQVAELLGIKPGSVRTARQRGRFPLPDMVQLGHPLWSRGTIERWAKSRRAKVVEIRAKLGLASSGEEGS